MDGKVSLARVVVTAPDDAPPLTEWLAAEAAQWIHRTYGQFVTVHITDSPCLVPTVSRGDHDERA